MAKNGIIIFQTISKLETVYRYDIKGINKFPVTLQIFTVKKIKLTCIGRGTGKSSEKIRVPLRYSQGCEMVNFSSDLTIDVHRLFDIAVNTIIRLKYLIWCLF